MGTYFHRLLDFLDQVTLRFAQASIVIMMLIISADAMGRYLFSSPLPGTLEVTTLYLMVILTYLGIPITYTRGRHIKLDILGKWRGNRYLATFRLCITLAVMGFISWHTAIVAYEKFRIADSAFGIIQFPLYWSYVWVPVGFGLLSVRIIGDLFFPRSRSAVA